MVVHAAWSMVAIAFLTALSMRTVTETVAPPLIAAWTGPRPQNAESIRTSTR